MELWDLGTSKPLPVKALYAVRIVLLIAPALGMVYFFTRVALFPVGAVPLVYLVVHGWLATIYRADRSVMLIYWGNAVSALLAAAMSVFFGYLLFALHGPDALLSTSGCSTRERYWRSWVRSCWSFSSRCSTWWFCAESLAVMRFSAAGRSQRTPPLWEYRRLRGRHPPARCVRLCGHRPSPFSRPGSLQLRMIR